MNIIYQYRIYRKDLKANPDFLYIFGDNLSRQGLGGQAKEMRDEVNAFGIATKRSITHNYPEDYFFDDQEDVTIILYEEFERLKKTIRENAYRTIVWPLDGIGTGLARMPEFAPKALKYIDQKFEEIKTYWGK